jgi:hypothetical protein
MWAAVHKEDLEDTKYYSVDQIKKNKMGGKCSTYGGYEGCIHDCGGEVWGKQAIWKTQT